MDLLMVRDRTSGRFVYVERMERRRGETPWEYARRSFRREGHIRASFGAEEFQVLVGWGTNSIKDFLESYPEFRPPESHGRASG